MTPDETRDLAATLQARRDLGPDYDDALASGFLERLDRGLDARIDARLAEQPEGRDGALPLAIVSMALGIPLTAITGAAMQSVLAVLIVWIGIVGVNVAYARSRQPRR